MKIIDFRGESSKTRNMEKQNNDYEDFLNDSEFDENMLNALEKSTPVNEEPQPAHLEVLSKKFGHSEFRPLQWKIIHSIIKDKRDNCAIMATGYGKSLCFQYPSVFLGGITLVISPLISLMEDQVAALTEKHIPACFLGTANTKQSKTIQEIFEEKFNLVYITPEFCTGDYGYGLLQDMHERLNIRLIAIDEAHCVSFWGHDFRTSYRQLGILRNVMPSVPILAVTATATPPVKKEIIEVLKLRTPQVLSSGLDRPNLFFAVCSKGYDLYQDIRPLMVHKDYGYKFEGPTIIYALTKNKTESMSDELTAKGIKSLPYHAGLSMSVRKEVQKKFTEGKIDVIVATIAFGMGIDKSNVRNVIHYGCPNSLEGYYQEAGRAGRDGLPSKCYIFYSEQDFITHKFLRQNLSQQMFEIRVQLIEKMRKYLQLYDCRRKFILSYFDGKDVKIDANSNCCDNCKEGRYIPNTSQFEGVNDSGLYDFTQDIKTFLSSIQLLNYPYGVSTFIDFLRGTVKKGKLTRFLNHQLCGSGKEKHVEWWKGIGKMCLERKLTQIVRARAATFSYEGLELSNSGRQFLQDSDIKVLEKPSSEMLPYLKIKADVWLSTGPQPGFSRQSSQATNAASRTNIWLMNNTPQLRSNSSLQDLSDKMDLLVVLKEKRDELAKEEKVPLFSIATDKALQSMATNKPVTLQQLKEDQYDGFTEEKIDKYGPEFIKIINKKKSIRDILRVHPLLDISVTMFQTYSLFLKGMSVEEIAKQRNVTEGTINNHLIQCIEGGFPIKLDVFGVTSDTIKTVTAATKSEPGPQTLTVIKSWCPEDITFTQIKAVLAYNNLRNHLNNLNIPFEDFNYCDEEQKCDQEDSYGTRDITELIDGLKEVQNCDDRLSDSNEKDSSSLTAFVSHSQEEQSKEKQTENSSQELQNIDVTDDDLLMAFENYEKSQSQSSKRLKLSDELGVDVLTSPNRSSSSENKGSQDSGSSANLKQVFAEIDDLLAKTKKDSQPEAISIPNSPPNVSNESDDLLVSKGNKDTQVKEVIVLDSPSKDVYDEFDDLLLSEGSKDSQLKGVSVLDSPPRISRL